MHGLAPGTPMLNPLHLYFVPTGRLGQLGYWLAIFALVCACMLSWPVLAALAPVTVPLLVYIFTCLMAKRLRDIGLRGRLAAAPVVAIAGYIFLIGVFSFLTIGCCGAGSGGDGVSRSIYRLLAGLDQYFVLAFPLSWFVAGLVPTPSLATPDDPLISPYR